MSCLHSNTTKSSIYSSEIIYQLSFLQPLFGFSSWNSPIRYLGMRLTTKILTSHDYRLLVDKVRGRMSCSSNKSLSYSGRLQLIKFVISIIVNFWNSTFILPEKCLDTIKSMCNTFFWSASPTQTHKAKVGWDDLS